MGLFGTGVYKGYQLSEKQCRYAMENTISNAEAARWLHVSFSTWKKYASMYIDEATGKNLYQLHKEYGMNKRLVLPKTRYRKKSNAEGVFQVTPIEEIFENKHLKYCRHRYKERLIKEGWLEERCACCGFQERRNYDFEMPLKLHWKDGNNSNFALENVELLCYNCYFINVGNVAGHARHFKIDETTGEPVPVRGDRKSLRNQMFKVGPHYKPRTLGPLVPDKFKKS